MAKDLSYPPGRATRLAALGTAVADTIGPIGFALLVAALIGAVRGGINAFTLAGSSLIASMAKNRFLTLGRAGTNDRHVLDKAVLAILAVNLVAPWAGREVVNNIVDMSSMLAVVAYGYTCFISVRIADTLASKVLSAIGLAFSLGFIALLAWPGSPGQLSGPAAVVLGIWLVIGVIVYLRARNHPDAPEIGESLWRAPELAGNAVA